MFLKRGLRLAAIQIYARGYIQEKKKWHKTSEKIGFFYQFSLFKN